MSEPELEIIDAEIVVPGAAPATGELVPLQGTLSRIDEPEASAEVERRVHDAWGRPRRRTCICGNVTEYGHGGFTCEEILGIRERVEYGQRSPRARSGPVGWRASREELEAGRERRREAQVRAEREAELVAMAAEILRAIEEIRR